jgi:leader peptidase (prepilin peptidase)/N-methyltransferase
MLLNLFLYLAITDLFFRLSAACISLYGRDDRDMPSSYSAYFREIGRLLSGLMPWKAEGRRRTASAEYAVFTGIALALLGISVSTLPLAEPALFAAYFGLSLLALSYVDAKTQYLPDALMLLALLLSLAQGASEAFLPWREALVGGAAGFGLLWTVNAVFKLVRKKDGMGGGDVRLAGILGLWLGWKALPTLLFLSSFLALAAVAFLALATRSPVKRRFAYGPALAAAGWILLAWGDKAAKWMYGG